MKESALTKLSRKILTLELDGKIKDLLVLINNQPHLCVFIKRPQILLNHKLNSGTRLQLFLNLNMPKEELVNEINRLHQGNIKYALACHYINRRDVYASEVQTMILLAGDHRLGKYLKLMKI